ncbi:MAG: N-glycosylase/DNA lyase [Candidatus Diapherotrites archaeon]
MEHKDNLKELYKKYKVLIDCRLNDFKSKWFDDEAIFRELIFCLLTPQSKALSCDACVKELFKIKPSKWTFRKVAKILRGKTRFYKQKAKNVILARNLFYKEGKYTIKKILTEQNIQSDRQIAREWLVNNVRGLGMKEASHFLRNIGFFDNIAIIDRHILKNMLEYGIISKVPKTITKKNYLELENKLKEFSASVGIPLSHLDLLLWAKETGYVFK